MSRTVALNSIPATGKTFVLEDPSIWEDPIRECSMHCRIVTPLRGELTVLPQEDGCLIRGTLSGEVAVPCTRCAEETAIPIDHRFDSFEPYGSSEDESEENAFSEEGIDDLVMSEENGVPVLNLAGLLWEEFVLALPVKILCRPDCRGICPECGKNLNDGPCGCEENGGDPRLAILRQLKIQK